MRINDKAAKFMAAFPKLTSKEAMDTYLVVLDDGRELSLPAVIYRHIRESGFSHGIKWAEAHQPFDCPHCGPACDLAPKGAK